MASEDNRNSSNLNELFNGNTSFYSIPRYQRAYVWTIKNWKQLYDDISYSLEDAEWSHFIGTFVFQKKDDDPQNVEYIVIDGQQRIVTIQLLFMAMIAALKMITNVNPESKETANNYIEIVKDLIKRKPTKGNKIHRVIIDYDENYNKISDFVLSEDENDDFLSTLKTSNISECFLFFYDNFCKKNIDEMIAFYEKTIITNYVHFNSYSEEYAFSIFETLNARGTQLKQMELVKNYMFHFLLPKDNIDNYKTKWVDTETLMYNNSLDSDEYLYHLFKCKFNVSKIREEDLYDLIKNQINRDPKAIKNLYDDIIRCIPIYIDVVKGTGAEAEISFALKYFLIKNNKQFRSVLMALFYKTKTGQIAQADLLRLIQLLRNFLLIYNIRHIPANKIDSDVQSLSYSVFNATCKRDIYYYVYKFLVKDRSFFCLSDISSKVAELRYSNHKRYSSGNSGMFKYMFELLLKEQYKDYEYISDYSGWTIEHIINDSCDDEVVSRIGNLLLMTSALNKKCDSKDYLQKRTLYLESGFCWVKDYAIDHSAEPQIEDILSRTEDLAHLLDGILRFDVSMAESFCEKTRKVHSFLSNIKKSGEIDSKIVNDIEYDDYDTIYKKLGNKFKIPELQTLLEDIK